MLYAKDLGSNIGSIPSIPGSGGYGQIDTPTYGSSLNKLFLDIINDASLEQFVYLPTCQDSILDFVFSPHPKISNLGIVPDISDHDTIIFDFNIIHQVSTLSFHKGDLQYQ